MQTINKPKTSSSTNGKEEQEEDKAWEVEVQAVKDIKEGKVEMVTQSADELLAELKALEDES